MNRLPHSARILLAVTGTGLATVLLLNSRDSAVSTLDSVRAPGLAAAAPNAAAPKAVTAGGAGTFTGPVIETQWGPVQVRITLNNGNLSNVEALQTPAGHRRSVSINQRATPILKQEALTAQSASIDTVSGATVTSEGYRESLQAALDSASSK